ncbi:MAG: phage portal protein [Eggerthellaceae bacterium]
MPEAENAVAAKAGAMRCNGRAEIRADYESVDEDNLWKILSEALPAFEVNKAQILYLWNYYKGVQPILERVKEVRPEINNKVVENHAQEIVSFKVGYQLAEPLQYTLRDHEGTSCPDGSDEETEASYDEHARDLNELNTLMHAADKAESDRDLFEYLCVCGIGHRMVEASPNGAECPFELHVLDPWSTFVVYSSAYHRRPLMAVWVGREQDGSKHDIYNVYTDEHRYLVRPGGQIVEKLPHTYGAIPIVEYRLNRVRMGAFEPVLPLLDAINAIESNRLDGIEQTVQSLMKFVNCEIDEETFERMLSLGAVKVSSPEGLKSDVDFIRNDLDQSQTQVTKDDLYQAVVNISGMPNRQSGGGSTSDTGAAVMLRDGWTLAETHAKNYELNFKRSERAMLSLVLGICKQAAGVSVDLRLRDIELTFSRRNYENVQVKAQVLTTMLASGQIHPEIAFKSCGMFTDPESAYLQSKRWAEEKASENEAKALEIASAQGAADEGEPDPVGSSAGVPEPGKGDDAAAHAAANA